MDLDMLQMRCRVFSIFSCYSFELDRNYIFQDVVWWKMKYYRKYEHGKRKSKGAQSPNWNLTKEEKTPAGNNFLLLYHISSFARCCEKFRLFLSWFTVSALGCRAEGNHENLLISSKCRRWRRVVVSVLRQERGHRSDVSGTPAAGYGSWRLDSELKDLEEKKWSVTSGEKMLMWTVWEVQQVKDSNICQDGAAVWLTAPLSFISRDS